MYVPCYLTIFLVMSMSVYEVLFFSYVSSSVPILQLYTVQQIDGTMFSPFSIDFPLFLIHFWCHLFVERYIRLCSNWYGYCMLFLFSDYCLVCFGLICFDFHLSWWNFKSTQAHLFGSFVGGTFAKYYKYTDKVSVISDIIGNKT